MPFGWRWEKYKLSLQVVDNIYLCYRLERITRCSIVGSVKISAVARAFT